MNRNDQKSIGELYTEGVLQEGSNNKLHSSVAAIRKILDDGPSTSAIAQIKKEIGQPGGMPYLQLGDSEGFQNLAVRAFREAGITTGAGLTWNKLANIIGQVLEAELDYNKGYDEDSGGYIFADVGYDYGQDEYTVDKE